MCIGIVLEINNKLYVAPLTMAGKEYLSVHLIYKRLVHPIENGTLGYIRIANMFPVPVDVLNPIFISHIGNDKYSTLLYKQHLYLKKDSVTQKIYRQAQKFYNIHNNKKISHILYPHLCNYSLLEKLCTEWMDDKQKEK